MWVMNLFFTAMTRDMISGTWVWTSRVSDVGGRSYMLIRRENKSDYEKIYDVVKDAFESAEHADGNE